MKFSLKLSLMSALSGLLSGLAATAFLVLLESATNLRDSTPLLIWGLPVAGLLIGLLYHRYGQEVARGHNLILEEIHSPNKTLPLRMAPLVFIGTLMTHLFGGSAGREGTAVQIGGSLADQVAKKFRITGRERRVLLMAGMGAGFGAAIGAPWAGAIFGMEVISVGSMNLESWFECTLASWVGYLVTRILQAPHTVYPYIEGQSFSLELVFFVVVAGVCFGLASRVFVALTHCVEKYFVRYISFPPLRPFVGGLLLVLFYDFEGSYQYAGLGITFIKEALLAPSHFMEPAFKALFTSLTVGSGFKGGEFIPLVFIGTTLGSALSSILPVSFSLLGALGFAAVFGGAANTPITCTLMAIEIFGLQIAPWALVACFVSYLVSSHKGIYASQPVQIKKHHRFLPRARRAEKI